MDSGQLLLAAIALLGASGLPGLFCRRHSASGQWLALLIAAAGAIAGLAAVLLYCVTAQCDTIHCPSPIAGADFSLAIDPLSAFFLAPIFVLALFGSLYGLHYWRQADHPDNGRKLRLFYGLFASALAVITTATSGVAFLFGWEAMALTGFLLVATENDEQSLAAAWLYLAASHFASLCLFAMFCLLAHASGSFALVPLAGIAPVMSAAVFILALLGFGTKAGIMPLHFWLPAAHATAPSHVSAFMSGVLIKMGVYGLVRVVSLLPDPPTWYGATLVSLGVVSAVLGIVFALVQHDLKRMLAYSSVENIGVIFIGLGLALVGRSLEQPAWVVLGLAGALLHVWNHGLFKSMLFFAAGSVIHATASRRIDRLGALVRTMPVTFACFLVGAVAISALPPLGGLVSEWLIYLGLFQTLGLGPGVAWQPAAFAAPALALVGALTLACFSRAVGIIFLGAPRSPAAEHAHESPWTMLLPMVLLAAACFVIGLAPELVGPLLQRVAIVWLPSSADAPPYLAELAPLRWISVTGGLLVVALTVGWAALSLRLRRGPLGVANTWGCGYAAPTPRMQYTGSSFAQILASYFRWVLGPPPRRPAIKEPFPSTAAFATRPDDIVLDRALTPALDRIAAALAWFRWLQQGSLQAYLLYVLAVVLMLLLVI